MRIDSKFDSAGDDWSRTEYLHEVLGFDLNITDFASEHGKGSAPIWTDM